MSSLRPVSFLALSSCPEGRLTLSLPLPADQHLWATTREVLVFALGAVFLVTSVLLGSWRTGSVVVLTVFLSTVNVLGVMGVWHISLNPISLVNLVISVGIAVEFCAHVARAFMGASGGGLPYRHPAGEKDRDERAWTALVDVGSSVGCLSLARFSSDTPAKASIPPPGRIGYHFYQAHRNLGPRPHQVQAP